MFLTSKYNSNSIQFEMVAEWYKQLEEKPIIKLDGEQNDV